MIWFFTEKLTAEEVANYLRDFIDGTGGEWDWDDFTSVPIRDPALNAIRKRAASLELPITAEGQTELIGLLNEADKLAAARSSH